MHLLGSLKATITMPSYSDLVLPFSLSKGLNKSVLTERSARWAVFSCMAIIASTMGCSGRPFTITQSANRYQFSLSGTVSGGKTAIEGASVQMFVMADAGSGAASQAVLASPVQTANDGSFTLTGTLTCPLLSSQTYLIASGGRSVSSVGQENKAAVLMTYTGACEDVLAQHTVQINELTTVGSIWPLVSFISSASAIGTDPAHVTSLNDAGNLAQELFQASTGAIPGPKLAPGAVAPTDKLRMLGALISACAISAGGVAGDDSQCGRLFAATRYPGSATPTNTFQAAVAIALHPEQNVSSIYQLLAGNPSNPVTSQPADFFLNVLSSMPPPTFSTTSRTYTTTQTVSVSDIAGGASIYYTLDGETPTRLSTPYTGPVPIRTTSTMIAVATLNGIVSQPSSVTVTILPTINVSPKLLLLGPSDIIPLSATANGTTAANLKWSLTPAVGTISKSGVYTAPLKVERPQTIVVTAMEASSGSTGTATVELQSTKSTLRSVGSARGLLIGAAADANEFGQQSPLIGNPSYANTLATEYNLLEPENAMKWAVIGATSGS